MNLSSNYFPVLALYFKLHLCFYYSIVFLILRYLYIYCIFFLRFVFDFVYFITMNNTFFVNFSLDMKLFAFNILQIFYVSIPNMLG